MQDHIKELEYCTYCPKMCRHSCPVGNALGSETYTPQSKMELLNMLRRGAVPWQVEYTVPLYGCTSCRLCREYCEHENDVAETLRAGRVEAEKRRLSHPALRLLHERFRERNTRLIAKMHQHYSAHLFSEEAQVGFFPGCDAIDHSIEDIRDALTVFDSLNLNFVRIVDAPYACAGYPLWSAGCTDAARFVATSMVKAIRRFATVVVGCPACAWLLREKLPAEGFEHNTEILHISEYLYVHAERLDVRNRQRAAFYHDPCYLSRYLEVTEPPRRLVSHCVEELKEFFYSGKDSECCGGGGLVPHTNPEVTKRQAQNRLDEVEMFGANLLITACPTCRRTFSSVESDVEVLDLINLLARAITDPERRALPEE